MSSWSLALRPAGRRWAAGVALTMIPGLLVSACAGSNGSGSGTSQQTATVLHYNFTGPPLGLQPAKNGTSDSANFTILTYDSLIYQAPDGRFEPDLATSWQYVGSGNRTFRFTLRPGVKFQDGTTLDADAVKASIDYYRSVKGPEQSLTSALNSVQVLGPMTVQLNFSQPVPDVPLLFSQKYQAGAIIGSKGLADPASLDTRSDGTGPYQLDWAHSVTNDHYTYTENPTYWNPKAIHYKTIVIHILGAPQAVLSALQTGQIDFATGSPQTASAAKSAGLTVKAAPFANFGLVLLDRAGTISKPLGDVRVRQAINLAIDRRGITKALYGSYAQPTDEPLGNIDSDAYISSLNDYYGYNPGRARNLLAQAGYPNGFTLPVLAESILDQKDQLAQAIGSDLGKVGINIQIKDVSSSISQFFGEGLSRTYPALIWSSGGGPDGYMGGQTILPTTGTFLNAFGSSDSQIDSWYQQANSSSDPAVRAKLYQQINRRLLDLAWFAPVCQWTTLYYMRPNVKNVQFSNANPTALPTSPNPAEGWYPGNSS